MQGVQGVHCISTISKETLFEVHSGHVILKTAKITCKRFSV